MRGDVVKAVGVALGSQVVAAKPVAGGDINEAYAATLADGRALFVKTSPDADPRMFPAEAAGLRWLAEAGALAVPDVLAVSNGDGDTHFLALELVQPGRRHADFDAQLGEGLAALHRYGAPAWGLGYDNFIGSLPQANDSAAGSCWHDFYAERRLRPLLERAVQKRRASSRLLHDGNELLAKLHELVGPDEPPARLHGDLWGGNLHTTADGAPCLIDPAVYGGHREMDLAMMRLFGGFSERVFEAYASVYPLAPGYDERVALYQLYPLLVHVNLFGGGYEEQALRAMGRYI